MKLGTLYVIATPIGNLSDISMRALEILRSVTVIGCEDTRRTSILLNHFGIKSRLVSLHAHNEQSASDNLLDHLKSGADVGLVSDAGTPLISDPGFYLVKIALEQGIKVSPVAGPCAAIAALSVSGISAHNFVFEGFLPAKSQIRTNKLHELKDERRTLIFYEAPHRLLSTVGDLAAIFGDNRTVTLVREISKTFETVIHQTLANLRDIIMQDDNQQRGECVLIVAGNSDDIQYLNSSDIKILELLITEMSLKKACQIAAQITGKRKNILYEYALKLDKKIS